jgi:hypothetical protein
MGSTVLVGAADSVKTWRYETTDEPSVKIKSTTQKERSDPNGLPKDPFDGALLALDADVRDHRLSPFAQNVNPSWPSRRLVIELPLIFMKLPSPF